MLSRRRDWANGFPQSGIGFYQPFEVEAAITTARVRQHPCHCPAKALWLPSPNHRVVFGDRRESRLAEKRDNARSVTPDLAFQCGPRLLQLQMRQLARSRRWPSNGNSQPVAVAQNALSFFGRNLPRCESRPM